MASPDNAGLHSADQFGPQGEYWWNPDFLELLARRWRLDEASSLADVGCGVGHWSRLLYPYLSAPARLVGVDREGAWVTESARRFVEAYRGHRAHNSTIEHRSSVEQLL